MTIFTDINAIPTPEGTDSQTVVADVADLTDVIDSLLVSRYATQAARDAANPTPIDGQFVYQLDKSQFSLRRNSDWHIQMMPTTVYKANNESLTSNTTLQADNELVFAAEANSVYLVEYVVRYTGGLDTGSLAGIKFSVTVPSGATAPRYHHAGLYQGSGAIRDAGRVTANSALIGDLTVPQGTTTGGSWYDLRLVLTTVATAGNVILNWAQATSNATPVVVLAGSTLTYTKIS